MSASDTDLQPCIEDRHQEEAQSKRVSKWAKAAKYNRAGTAANTQKHEFEDLTGQAGYDKVADPILLLPAAGMVATANGHKQSRWLLVLQNHANPHAGLCC
jgi:hypothetical protein